MKREWSEEERKAIQAKFAAEFTAEQLEREYAEALQGELIPFEDVIREAEERQRHFDRENPAKE